MHTSMNLGIIDSGIIFEASNNLNQHWIIVNYTNSKKYIFSYHRRKWMDKWSYRAYVNVLNNVRILCPVYFYIYMNTGQ